MKEAEYMSHKKYSETINEYEMSKKIEKAFGQFKVNITISDWTCQENRIFYKAKSTRWLR